MKIFYKWLLVLLTIGALSGCATVADPVVRSEQKENVALLPVKKVLVVFDLGLEFKHMPSGLLYSKMDNTIVRYEPVAKALVNELKAQGIDSDYVLHTEESAPFIPAEYSQVWVQRINKLMAITYQGGKSVEGRNWGALILQRQRTAMGGIFAYVYSAEYIADGPECFTSRGFSNAVECRKTYMAFVAQQWRKSGLTKW